MERRAPQEEGLLGRRRRSGWRNWSKLEGEGDQRIWTKRSTYKSGMGQEKKGRSVRFRGLPSLRGQLEELPAGSRKALS